jgi:hypothetical protein
MTPETQKALTDVLERRGINAVDDDIFSVLPVPDDLNVKDDKALAAFANKIIEEKPALFKTRNWETLNDADFVEKEKELRNRLGRSEPASGNEFASLDAALLKPEQEAALRKYLSGRAGKFDKSILKAALASQRRLFGGDAA